MKFTWWSMILIGIVLGIVGSRLIGGLLGDGAVMIGVIMVLVGLLSGYRVYKENKKK